MNNKDVEMAEEEKLNKKSVILIILFNNNLNCFKYIELI